MKASVDLPAEGIHFDPDSVETPYAVIDLSLLRKNLALLKSVAERSGARILLAQKGFATWSVYPLCAQYLSGVTSSSVHEARLGREEFKKEVHVYAPAYSAEDIRELCDPDDRLADHLVFNSVPQFRLYAQRAEAAGISCGLRVNPEHREVATELYDPCAPGSRLGATAATIKEQDLSDAELKRLKGVHFHNLCQKNSDSLERTLDAVEMKFSHLLSSVDWVNFGGGHHITRPDYDVERLVSLIKGFAQRWDVQIYLEPGEAIALNTGFLVAEVLDLVPGAPGGIATAILDTSATAHMPDVLEMPYRPEIIGGGEAGEKPFSYRLGGLTCLAGDVIGDWSFDEALSIGDRLIFTDMAHYTSVKSTTFNGVRLPSVVLFDPELAEDQGRMRLVRRFGYNDYKSRLS